METCRCLTAGQSMASSCSAASSTTPQADGDVDGVGGQVHCGTGARAFSSDSGFSSELYESTLQRSSDRSSYRSNSSRSGTSASASTEQTIPPAFQRGGKWTASFRKLLTRVSSRKGAGSAAAAAAAAGAGNASSLN